MHTFVLSRDVEEIPTFLDIETKALILTDCASVAGILFRRCPYWEHRLMYIPTVAMWEGYEAAFLEYWQIMADSFHRHAMKKGDDDMHKYAHASLAALLVFKEELWGTDYAPESPRALFEINNPFPRASDDMIRSHWAELIRQYPDLAKDAPMIEDLSADPFMSDWA